MSGRADLRVDMTRVAAGDAASTPVRGRRMAEFDGLSARISALRAVEGRVPKSADARSLAASIADLVRAGLH